jgi:hypothetical protein
MTKAIKHFLFLVLAAVTLMGCGGGSDEGPVTSGGGGSPTPPADVTLGQLQGNWFGSFDDTSTVRSMRLIVDATGNITTVELEGVDTDLTGTITKASGVARTFRFALSNSFGDPISQGLLMADPAAAYLVFLDKYSGFGVVQKGATALPTYAKADVERSWAGDTITTNSDFTTIAQRTSSATCTSTNATTSQCNGTVSGGTTRAITSLTPDDPKGRWIGNYADTVTTGTPSNGIARAYLSPDKSFAAAWACSDTSNGLAGPCDFSSWKAQ